MNLHDKIKYDSGNKYLDKLRELIEDLKINKDNYSSQEETFIMDLEDDILEFEIGEMRFNEAQKEKIDELYKIHGIGRLI